jgi:transcriptional regulator with XRE-family HTH domain
VVKPDLNDNILRRVGAQLKRVREAAKLTQAHVCLAMGMTSPTSRSYLRRIEKGELRNIQLVTVLRYLQACRAPVGRFLLELAHSGAFGEAEQGLVLVEAKADVEEAKRTKTRQVHERRSEREAQDSAVIAQLWREVAAAIQPVLAQEHPSRRHLAPYLEGVRALYRAWKQATRGAGNKDPVPDIQMAFDRIEQTGAQRLVPAAMRKMREIVFERLRGQ